ncbi:unnamed protein product [Ophioblennius macclurei]
MSEAWSAEAEKKRPPPVKVLSGQLRAAGNRGSSDGGGEGCVLRLTGGRRLPVTLAWMQGTVLEVQPHADSVLLMDETGTFTVQGVGSVPRGKPCLTSGKYVMVMGVIRAVSPEPVIRAVKMADLSELAALHRRMWKLEVEDLQHMLA